MAEVYLPEGLDEDVHFEYVVIEENDVPSNVGAVDVRVVQPPEGEDQHATTVVHTPVNVDTPFGPDDMIIADDLIVTEGDGEVTYNENDGTFTITPDPGFTGEITVEVTACDAVVEDVCSTSTITVQVVDAPTLEDESTIVAPGGTVHVSPTTSVDGGLSFDPSSLAIVDASGAPNGTCSIENGEVAFHADAQVTLPAPPNVCIVEICLAAPSNVCATANFAFTILDDFEVTEDELAIFSGNELVIDADKLLEVVRIFIICGDALFFEVTRIFISYGDV